MSLTNLKVTKMDELKAWNQLTAAQQKQLKEVLSKAQISMAFAGVKFLLGLFAASTISIFVGAYIMGPDTNENMKIAYSIFTCVTNGYFLSRYFSATSNNISVKLKEQISTIAKQSN